MKLYPVVFMLSWGREDFSAPTGDFEKLPWRSWEKRTPSYQKVGRELPIVRLCDAWRFYFRSALARQKYFCRVQSFCGGGD